MIKASISGVTIGPPADRECAVDPAWSRYDQPVTAVCGNYFSFIYNLIEISLDKEVPEITASFNPRVSLITCLERITLQVNNILCEITYSPAKTFSRESLISREVRFSQKSKFP
jgi:hypothetical protein